MESCKRCGGEMYKGEHVEDVAGLLCDGGADIERERVRAQKAEARVRELEECAQDAVTKMAAAIDRAEKAERELAEWPCVSKDARRREHTWNIAHAVGSSYCVHCEVKERDAGHRIEEEQPLKSEMEGQVK